MNLDPGADVTGPATEPGVVPPTVDVISIADDLRSIAPTEIVALSAGRGLVEVSLPSGRVRTTDLRLATEQPGVTTTDFGALVWARDESDSGAATYLVIAEGGRSTPIIGTTRLAEARSTPTRDEFFLWAPETSTPTVITADGRIEARPAATDRPIPSGPIDPGGGVLDQDTGGVYRTDESGTVRLSTGDLLATGRNHVLVHACDSRRTCRLVVIDGALDTGGDRRRNSAFTTGDLADDHPVWSPLHDGLAPDGSAFLAVSDTDRRELSIVSATDGTITPVYASSSFELHAAWASDSSGVFFADGALRFFRRADAVVTLVSDVLPEVRMVTTRVPRRSVTCELAIAAAARFDGMRTGTEVGAPSGESLDALRMTAPSELAAATDALATFVGAFVSAERTDSERIENWPANVRAGIDAIDRFARTDC